MDAVDDGGKASALKITLPEMLSKELGDFASSNGLSKSEVIQDAIRQKLQTDPAWGWRLFFFKRRSPNPSEANWLKALVSSAQGALFKFAVCNQDIPHLAQMWVGSFVKVSGRNVHFQFLPYRPTPLLNSSYNDAHEIQLADGKLVVPTIHPSSFVPMGHQANPQLIYIFSIDISYVWDVDLSSPKMTQI